MPTKPEEKAKKMPKSKPEGGCSNGWKAGECSGKKTAK